ncbi:MAG: hypothetical protein ABIJ96_05055 [Elusimicrobiota bacterium]
MTSSLQHYASAYAALAGREVSADDIRRRTAAMPPWARGVARASAWAIRWWAPLFFLGRCRRFEQLSAEDADALLRRLQFTRCRMVRGAFTLLKVIVLPACYGRKDFLSSIGYSLTERPR